MRAEPRHKPISLEAVTLLTEGRVAEAVKVERKNAGVSAREARHRVKAHIAGDAILAVQLQAQRQARRRRWWFWTFLVIAVAAAGYVWYFYFDGSLPYKTTP